MGFNGATSFQTWKSRYDGGELISIMVASMGPRLFRRGNPGSAYPCTPSSFVLQWGHVFSDVEIAVNPRPGYSFIPHASMGPRLFRRGNGLSRRWAARDAVASMGPRLFRRGNSGKGLHHGTIPYCFNGATSFQTWK